MRSAMSGAGAPIVVIHIGQPRPIFGNSRLCAIEPEPTGLGLWVFDLMVAAAVALFALARFGQKLGAAQASRLHQIVESATERIVT